MVRHGDDVRSAPGSPSSATTFQVVRRFSGPGGPAASRWRPRRRPAPRAMWPRPWRRPRARPLSATMPAAVLSAGELRVQGGVAVEELLLFDPHSRRPRGVQPCREPLGRLALTLGAGLALQRRQRLDDLSKRGSSDARVSTSVMRAALVGIASAAGYRRSRLGPAVLGRPLAAARAVAALAARALVAAGAADHVVDAGAAVEAILAGAAIDAVTARPPLARSLPPPANTLSLPLPPLSACRYRPCRRGRRGRGRRRCLSLPARPMITSRFFVPWSLSLPGVPTTVPFSPLQRFSLLGTTWISILAESSWPLESVTLAAPCRSRPWCRHGSSAGPCPCSRRRSPRRT